LVGQTMTRLRVVWALLGFVLAACSSDVGVLTYLTPGKVPEPPPLVPTRYPERYRSDIADYMRTSLDNPGKVKDAFVAQPTLKPVSGTLLYVTCVRYNARNNANQYLGERTDLVIFLDGKPNQVLRGDANMCGGLNYQRYPELEALGPP
jgi:hypothetical protein